MPGPIIPPVGQIEQALEMLARQSPKVVTRQLKEFRNLGESVKTAVVPPDCTSLEAGYLIGLETARAVVNSMAKAVQAGVEL